jgi:capsular polysaccharide biosynthesis protein
MPDRPDKFEDGIALMDYLQVIWKWKYLILGGTLLCALAAGVISFKMPKVYRISIVLRPGILRIQDDGNNLYIDSPQNIQGLIETGMLDKEILDSIKNPNRHDLLKELEFKVNIPRQSNTLKVLYETSDIDIGVNILNNLSRIMMQKYSQLIKYYQKDYEKQINLAKTDIANQKAVAHSLEQQIKNLQKRIDELILEIELITKNTVSLIKERDNFISRDVNSNNILSVMLYTNIIQQNIMLSNNYKDEVNEYYSISENNKVSLEKAKNDIQKLLEEMKDWEFRKNSIQNIEILQPARSSPYPIRPKVVLNVMLAAVISLLLMLFVAFFLEYLSKYKKREHQ